MSTFKFLLEKIVVPVMLFVIVVLYPFMILFDFLTNTSRIKYSTFVILLFLPISLSVFTFLAIMVYSIVQRFSPQELEELFPLMSPARFTVPLSVFAFFKILEELYTTAQVNGIIF